MTDKTTMTAERFAALLEAYGADLARWPREERLAAHAYAGAAPQAGALRAEARAIDALLDAVPAPKPRPALEAAILTGMPRVTRRGAGLVRLLDMLWPRAAVWKPASVFASALVLGALIGVNVLGGLAPADIATGGEDVLAYAVPQLIQGLN